jgi:drug/metabolite transporter (DMT)-like permease
MSTGEPLDAAAGAVAGDEAHARLAGWLPLGVVYVVWGSTYLAIRVADESLPPLFMAGIRYLVAGALLLPFVVRQRRPKAATASRRVLTWPSLAELGGCAVAGVLLLADGNGGVSWAETRLSSGLAALLVASVPLWMVGIEAVATRRAPSALALVALVIGFAGVGVLAAPGGRHESLAGIVAVLLASLSWAGGSLLVRRLPHPPSPFATTAYQMLVGGLVLLGAAAATGELTRLDLGAVSGRSWLSLAYLIGPGSILALTCYTEALRRLPTSVVGTYAYVNPIIAVLLGWSILSEQVRAPTLLGGALVVVAVALVIGANRSRH